jgi:flagellar biosynthesis regulator FlaF
LVSLADSTLKALHIYSVKNKKVYILGAGCSVSYGYPLAKDFLDALKQYLPTLERRANCERLKQCLTNTIALIEKHRAPTTDRLVRWIEDEVARQKQPLSIIQAAESNQLDQKAWDKIRDAKIVTVALFLEREAAAWQSELASYEAFLHIIFSNSRNPGALKSTADCVLSFNYDRLFEMAFIDYFQLPPQENCYAKNWLNAGLDFSRNQESDFASDQFCFLKLHGTAAMQVAEKRGQARYGMNALRKTEWIVDDNSFWPTERKASPLPKENPEPLIVFPHEKERAREANTAFNFDSYIRKTWDQAGKVIGDAEQIWAIGYSFDPTDRKSIFELLRKNKAGCDIVVQNPEAETICNELKLRYSDLGSRLKPLSAVF